MFLDLQFNSLLFGIIAILIGLYFLTTNYASGKRSKITIMLLISFLNAQYITFLISYSFWTKDDFSIVTGYKIIAIDCLITPIFLCISSKLTTRFFCAGLGTQTAFCFINILEIDFLYMYKFNRFIDTGVAMGVFIIATNCVPFEVFEYEISYCGAYFLVKGVNMIVYHDQIAQVKNFLYINGFSKAGKDGADIFGLWEPLYLTAAILVLTIISGLYKRNQMKKIVKIELHPYYVI